MYSPDYFASLFVAHLHPGRPRSRLKFPNIGHTLIVAYFCRGYFHNFTTSFFHSRHGKIKYLNLLC